MHACIYFKHMAMIALYKMHPFEHENMYPNILTRKGNFQLSNADTFPHNHDEIDIELLGHEIGRAHV